MIQLLRELFARNDEFSITLAETCIGYIQCIFMYFPLPGASGTTLCQQLGNLETLR